MKEGNMNKILKVGTLGLFLSASVNTMAQEDDFLANTSSYDSEQIDIDGSFTRKDTPSERMAKLRKKLEQQNEQMVQKKIEDIRLQQEQELAGKLKNAFQNNMQQMDMVNTYQAAPAQNVTALPVEAEEIVEEKKNKIIPSFGVQQYNGEGIDSFESNMNVNLAVENMITPNLGLGVNVGYSTMDITTRNNFNNGFGIQTDGDEIAQKNLNIGLTGKFFISTDSRIKPFLGAGVGYNRMTLEFEKRAQNFTSTTYNPYGYNYNTNQSTNTSVSASNVNASGMVGAEVDFTPNFGMVVDFKYTKALTSGFEENNSASNSFNQSDLDKAALKNMGNQLEESDIAALNFGFLIKF